MDRPNAHPSDRSYYQMDPQVTGDQLRSHPTHDLHNAAYSDSDYQPVGYTPPPPGASSHANAVGQDSKPYPPSPPRHEMPSDSIHDAAYPNSNYRPGGGYSPSAGPSTELASHDVHSALYTESHYAPEAGYSLSGGKSAAAASDIIDGAAYPDSSYRPGTVYPAAGSPGFSNSCPLPCPKHLESAPSSHTRWTRGAPSSSTAGPSDAGLSQVNGSELPPPPYQPGASDSGAALPSRPSQTQPASPNYARRENPYEGYQTPNQSPLLAGQSPQQQDMIPMTTFPVSQNAIGHVANRSNASSALERGYKEYDRDQAKLDEGNRRSNRRKWLVGTLTTTVIVAATIGVVVALLKFKVLGGDDDDD